MSTLRVAETSDIEAAMDIVMAQFADLRHHSQTQLHRGVRFEVISETDETCQYRQTTQIGPLRLKQEISLDKTQSNPQVNRITKGQFSGGFVSFDFQQMDAATTRVTARVATKLSGVNKLLKPLLERNVASALRGALAEDKADIESGRYSPPN